MVKVGKWIAKNKILILILATILLIPSLYGMKTMKTNYDLLTYLPKNLDTVKGQDIVVDQFGMGAFSMVVVENKALKDTAQLEKDIEAIPHVSNVLWYDDVADLNLPIDMVPEDLRKKFFNGDATMMLVLLDDTSSSDTSLAAERQIRTVLDKDCYISGIPSVMNDIQDLTEQELPIYVSIAVILSLIAMLLLTDSFVVPFLFLIDIGYAVLYNMGTNQMFGKISYITKAIAAILQLGVTMDYSIFLLGSYRENKERFPGDNNRAMGHAIANTFKSIIGSSVTTIAGFIALCFMSFTLGFDLGLVMAKGVLFGVVTCITVLPSLVLLFDKPIMATTHRTLLGHIDKASDFITKHYPIWLIIFAIMFVPALYGNNHVTNYYDMSSSLPTNLTSMIGHNKVDEEFGSSTIDMVLYDKNLSKKLSEYSSLLENTTATQKVISDIIAAQKKGAAAQDGNVNDAGANNADAAMQSVIANIVATDYGLKDPTTISDMTTIILAGLQAYKSAASQGTDAANAAFAKAATSAVYTAAGFSDASTAQATIQQVAIATALVGANSGLNTLTSNDSTLLSGVNTLSDSVKKYTDGVDTAYAGSQTLADGTASLNSGLQTIASNNYTLVSGINSLKTASGQIKNGIKKLLDGSNKLSDGTQEYYDNVITKGLKPLTKSIDKLQDIADGDYSYDNFSGIADGMDGTVRFVITTESIKEDDSN